MFCLQLRFLAVPIYIKLPKSVIEHRQTEVTSIMAHTNDPNYAITVISITSLSGCASLHQTVEERCRTSTNRVYIKLSKSVVEHRQTEVTSIMADTNDPNYAITVISITSLSGCASLHQTVEERCRTSTNRVYIKLLKSVVEHRQTEVTSIMADTNDPNYAITVISITSLSGCASLHQTAEERCRTSTNRVYIKLPKSVVEHRQTEVTTIMADTNNPNYYNSAVCNFVFWLCSLHQPAEERSRTSTNRDNTRHYGRL
ncbi:hypothetical protein J6590_004728 [Homalodisca vitripennis]|nr:hypothetical protein J6590_004728 [Homalodisca vitripennis]